MVLGVAQQPDGKIVAVVSTLTNFDGITVVRFNRNGTIDRGFGRRGVVQPDPIGGTEDSPTTVAIDPQGRIVVGGTALSLQISAQGNGFLFVRLLANGAIDPTFGNNGSVLTDFGGFANLKTFRFLGDGAIVAVGTTPSGFAIAHYTIDGRLDPRFGVGGEVTSAFEGIHAPNSPMLIAANGATYVADSAGILARYAPVGALDPAFGTGGLATLPGAALRARLGRQRRRPGRQFRQQRPDPSPRAWGLIQGSRSTIPFGADSILY